ncbi:MAG: cation-translocating P-type ATPase [Verrucomicrobiota bacterium]|nr:cation-translocating P-type ATPase [Verrucomicrobiota bacterium]
MRKPYLFDEFFASGREESISPFLTPDSRKWGKHLSLKSALSAAFFLVVAFGLSFVHPPLSSLFLSMVYFLAGVPALIAAFDDLKNLEINIDVLMTLAAFLAVAIGSGLEGALLLVLFELSHGMEEAVSKKARSALHHLNNLAPKFARVVDEKGVVFEQAVRDIPLRAHLLIKQGEIAPLDGTVIEGISSVNLIHLTGESTPILKKAGDTVPAGARNLEAALVIEVTRLSSDSTLTRIVQLITQAQEAKPQVQRWLDRFSKTYASSVIGLTVLFALTLPWIFSIPYLGTEGAIYRALAFLIAASPCALIIATPTAYLSAISACARKGILLKGGIIFDALTNCQTIAFDKTGTLTTGKLQCNAIEPIGHTSLSSDEALAIAASLERHVVHPIANAISQLATDRNLSLPTLENFKTTPGSGLEGILPNGQRAAIGLPEHIAAKLPPSQAKLLTEWSQNQGASGQVLAALSVGDDLFAFRFSDQVRSEITTLLQTLRANNKLHPIMLTGDHLHNASLVGRLLGIEHIFANLRPEDKLAKVAELADTGGLAMVGDGINDAPALARATVGISMGRIGSATAVDASDVVLLNDDLHLLSYLFSKASSTQAIVRQNLCLALSVICLATIPALLGLLPLWIAVLLHEGGTVLVGLNSLRLLR